MLKRNSLTIFNVHSNTTVLTANFSLVKGENRLAVYCIDDFGKVWNVLAKRPLLPCIPHRRGLFWLNNPDIMEFSLWKRFTTWSIPLFVVQKNARASIVLNIEWVQFVLKNCAKLHSVRGLYDKKQRLHVYLGCNVQKVQKAAFFSRHQICWQDFVRVNLSNTKIRPDYLFCLPF